MQVTTKMDRGCHVTAERKVSKDNQNRSDKAVFFSWFLLFSDTHVVNDRAVSHSGMLCAVRDTWDSVVYFPPSCGVLVAPFCHHTG